MREAENVRREGVEGKFKRALLFSALFVVNWE